MSTTYTQAQRKALPEIHNVMHALANSQDAIDLALFEAVWIQDQPVHWDISKHLPDYPPTKIWARELTESLQLALSGFEGTQHSLTNMTVRFEGDGDQKAIVWNQTTAIHYLDLKDGKGNSVVVRNVWKTSVQRQGDGRGVPAEYQALYGPMDDWAIAGIEVIRDLQVEGRMELYELAKKRAESGLGREAVVHAGSN